MIPALVPYRHELPLFDGAALELGLLPLVLDARVLEGSATDTLLGSQRFALFVRFSGDALAVGARSGVLRCTEGQFVYGFGQVLTFEAVAGDQVLAFCFDGTDMFVRRDGVELVRVAASSSALDDSPFELGRSGGWVMPAAAMRGVVLTADATTFPTADQIEKIEAYLAAH